MGTNNKLTQAASTAMLIRKPVQKVFEAFINPEITTKFWFTKSSGRLQEGATVIWTWEMYGVSTQVVVTSIVENQSIIIEWGNNGQQTLVEWTFEVYNDEATFVSIVNSGFEGDVDTIIAQVRDSTGGFTWVLAGLKAYLEHGIELGLIGDRFPKGK